MNRRRVKHDKSGQEEKKESATMLRKKNDLERLLSMLCLRNVWEGKREVKKNETDKSRLGMSEVWRSVRTMGGTMHNV